MDSVRSFSKYKAVYLDVETHELSPPPYYDVSVQLAFSWCYTNSNEDDVHINVLFGSFMEVDTFFEEC